MAYEQKDNSGTLFKNDRKEKDTHADYKGSVLIEGTEYWISGWLKGGQNGKAKFMSLAFNAKDGQAKKPTPAPSQERGNPHHGDPVKPDDSDESVPF